jgi:Transcriptional regulatory protein, C terminal
MLLEHPGEVVTREQLHQKLWPADTFVDFDVGLNSAVKKLREALGDSAETPRYVETLPRGGYRLISPAGSPVLPQTTGSKAALPGRFWGAFAPAVLTLIVLLTVLAGFNVGGARSRLLGKPPLAPIQSLAVLPLENHSGDPA